MQREAMISALTAHILSISTDVERGSPFPVSTRRWTESEARAIATKEWERQSDFLKRHRRQMFALNNYVICPNGECPGVWIAGQNRLAMFGAPRNPAVVTSHHKYYCVPAQGGVR